VKFMSVMFGVRVVDTVVVEVVVVEVVEVVVVTVVVVIIFGGSVTFNMCNVLRQSSSKAKPFGARRASTRSLTLGGKIIGLCSLK
jgi:hypothetical protein